MSKYLVKLTPLGKFFFGGDMTFRSDRKKNNDDRKYASYIIHSFMMPQQTSLLGMLRFLLLSNDATLFDKVGNHIKAGVESEVTRLIGSSSFSVSEGHCSKNFGKIDKIGPCFLYDKVEKKAYFKVARGYELDVNLNIIHKAFINDIEMQIPEIQVKERQGKKDVDPLYSSKDCLKTFYALANGSCLKEENELFKEDSRIGIDKDYEGKAKDAAFYKQISYRFVKKDFCFAFEVEIKEDITLTDYSKTLVKLGADDSLFLFEAEILDKEVEYPQNENNLRVVLISDSYLSQKDSPMKFVRYAITQIQPFRFLSTVNSTEAKDYNVKYRTLRSKERYDLYQAGSVFYFEDENKKHKFCNLLNKYQDFVLIGYNKYC